jgi:arylsulfatase A-like enzyme
VCVALAAACDDGPSGDDPSFDALIVHDAEGSRARHGARVGLAAFADGYRGRIECRWSLGEPFASAPSLLGVTDRDIRRCDLAVTLPLVQPGTSGSPATLPEPVEIAVEVTAAGTSVTRSTAVTIAVTNDAPRLVVRADPSGELLTDGGAATLLPATTARFDVSESLDPDGDEVTVRIGGGDPGEPCAEALLLADGPDRLDVFYRPVPAPAERCPVTVTAVDPYGAESTLSFDVVLDDTDVAGARPNVVVILLNDVGPGDLSAEGNTVVDTPSIDGLAADGTSAELAYAFPGDAPSAAALLTGRHPLRFGLRGPIDPESSSRSLPREALTLAEVLGSAGYATATYGRWALGGQSDTALPSSHGFDEHAVFHTARYVDPVLSDGSGELRFAVGHETEVVGDLAVAYVADHAPGPFFLEVAFLAVGGEPVAPAHWLERYEGLGLAPAAQSYAALIGAVDEQIGRILAALDEHELAERTIVIVTSDEGGRRVAGVHDGATLRGEHGSLHEGGTRVPFLVRWPGRVRAGARVGGRITLLDALPTLGVLAGLDLAALPQDGASLAPHLLFGADEPLERDLFWELRPSNGAAVVRASGMTVDAAAIAGDDKLVLRAGAPPTADVVELFDLAGDPNETASVGAARPERVEELTSTYARWRLATSRLDVTAERILGAASVDGTSISFADAGRVVLAPNPLFDHGDGDLTFTAVVELTDLASGDRVVAERDRAWELSLAANGHFVLVVGPASGVLATLTSVTTVARLERTRVAVVFASGLADSEGAPCHGVALVVGTAVEAFECVSRPLDSGSDVVALGAADDSFGRWFVGNLLGVELYSAALTTSELARLSEP